MKITVKDRNAFPSRAHPTDAGLDLKSIEDTTILKPGDRKFFSTGVCAEIPIGYVGLLFIRSGLGTKTKFKLANGTGIIDSDYRGEIMACIENSGAGVDVIKQYDRIVQLVIVPVLTPELEVVSKLSETKRGIGGFGHTDTKMPKIGIEK
jgi:dUTP pyrophosphatase